MSAHTEAVKLAFLDTETTGLDARTHQVWELAVIIREPHMPDVEYLWQIRPDLDRADPKSLEINRFHDRFAVPDGWDAIQIYEDGGRERQHLHEALFEIQHVLRHAYLVGAVPSFDAAMLGALLHSRQRRIPWQYRLVCVETLVAGALRLPVPIGLSKAAEAVGLAVDREARHGGMYDARLARDVYDAVMAAQSTEADLHRLRSQSEAIVRNLVDERDQLAAELHQRRVPEAS